MAQFRKRSLLQLFRNLLQRIPGKPLDINCLHFLEYDGIPPCEAAFSRGRSEVREATVEDLKKIPGCQTTQDVFRKRFQSGDHCVVAVAEGRVVGFEWFCDRLSYVEERYAYEIKIPPDTIYAYDAFILPEHRLSGVWLKFKTVYLRNLMQKTRSSKIVTMIDHGNRLSMNTHVRFGFRLFRTVSVLKILGKCFFFEKKTNHDESAFLLSCLFTTTLKAAQVKNPGFSRV